MAQAQAPAAVDSADVLAPPSGPGPGQTLTPEPGPTPSGPPAEPEYGVPAAASTAPTGPVPDGTSPHEAAGPPVPPSSSRPPGADPSEQHTSGLQSPCDIACRL